MADALDARIRSLRDEVFAFEMCAGQQPMVVAHFRRKLDQTQCQLDEYRAHANFANLVEVFHQKLNDLRTSLIDIAAKSNLVIGRECVVIIS